MKRNIIRSFGKGNFSLPILKDNSGQEICSHLLTNDQTIKLLSTPNFKDVVYFTSALLFRTDLEFFQYGLDFLSLNKKLEAVNHHHTLSVEKKLDGETDYYLLDLSKCFQQNTAKDHYWIKVKDQQIDVANILISKDEISIFSNYSICIIGITDLFALQVYTDHQVFIKDNLSITNIFLVYAKELILSQNGATITANKCAFYCTEYCETNGDLKINNLQIKTPFWMHNGYIESKNLAHIITYETKQNGDIFAEKGVAAVAHKWSYKNSKNKLVTTHSPEFVQIMICEYDHGGCISTNHLLLNTWQSTFKGDLIVAKRTHIEAERYLEEGEKSRFYFNGQVEITSKFTAKFSGKIIYCKDLTVDWKKISLLKTIDANTIIEGHEQLKRVVKLHADACLEKLGKMYVQEADICMQSNNKISMDGVICHDSGLFEKYNIYLKSSEIESKGDILTTGKINLAAKNDFLQQGHIIAKEINIAVKDFHLAPNSSLSTSQLNVQGEGLIDIDKQSLIDAEFIYMRGRDVLFRGISNSKRAAIEAKRLIYFKGNNQCIDQLIVTAPIVALVGVFKGIKQLSSMSYLSSMTGFFLVKQMNISSLLSFNPLSLTLQYSSTFPSKVTLAMTFINAGLSIANLVAPQTQALTIPLQIALNSVSQLYSTKQMLEQARVTVQHLRGNHTTSDEIRTTIIISQFVVTLSSIILSIRNSFTGITKFSLPRSVTFQTPNALLTLKTVGSSLSRIVSGNNNFSLVDCSLEKSFIGIGNTESHAFSFSVGDIFSLVNSETNLISIKSNINFVLGPSSSTSIIGYDSGNTWSLLGNTVTNYGQLTLIPFLNKINISNSTLSLLQTYYNWSIHADRISYPLENYQFNNSSLKTTDIFVVNTQHLQFKHCSVIATEIENKRDLEFDDSIIKINHIYNDGKVVIINSLLNGDVNNYGTWIVLASQIHLNVLSEHRDSQMQFALSIATIGTIQADEKSLLCADASDLTIGNIKTEGSNTNFSIRSSHIVAEEAAINGKFDAFNSDLNIAKITGNNESAHVSLDDSWLITQESKLTINPKNSCVNGVPDSVQPPGWQWKKEDIAQIIRLYHLFSEHKLWASLHRNKFTKVGETHEQFLEKLHKFNSGLKYGLWKWEDLAQLMAHFHFTSEFKFTDDGFLDDTPALVKETNEQFLEKQLKFDAKFEDGEVLYSYKGALNISGQEFYSILPIAYHASGPINIKDKVYSLGSIDLIADEKLLADHAQIILDSNSHLEGKKGTDYISSNVMCEQKLELKTDGKFVNYASNLLGDKGLNIITGEDVTSDPNISITTEKHKKWRWHGIHSGEEIITETKTTVIPASFQAPNGKINIYAKQDDVHIVGTYFNAKEINFGAKDGSVIILDVLAKNTKAVKDITFVGVSKDTTETIAFLPSELLGKDNVTIRAKNKFLGRGVIIDTDTFVVRAKSAILDRSIGVDKFTHEAFGLMLEGAPNSIFSGAIDPISYMPLVDAGRQITNAQSTLGTSFAIINFGIEGTNKANGFLSDRRNGSSINTTGITLLFCQDPLTKLFSFSATLDMEKSSQAYEVLGPGSIHAKHVDIQVEDTLTFGNSFELKVTQDATFSGKDINFTGATLHSSFSSEQLGVGATASLWTCGLTDVAVNTQDSNSSQTINVVNTIDVPNLTINTDQLTLKSTVINANELHGHANKINIISEKNQTTSKSAHGSVGLSGVTSFGEQDGYDEKIPVQSSFNVKDAADFKASEIQTISATTSVIADKMASSSLTLQKSQDGFDISGNITDFTSYRPPSFIPNVHNNNNVFNTIDVTITRDDERINFKLPFINNPGLDQFKDNIAYFSQREMPNTQQDDNELFQDIDNSLQEVLFNPAEVENTDDEKLVFDNTDFITQADPSQVNVSKKSTFYAYSKALLTGAIMAGKDTVDTLLHPYDRLLSPTFQFVDDTEVLLTNGYCIDDSENSYQAASHRMHERLEGAKALKDEFLNASGPHRVEMATEFLVSTLLPGTMAKGAKLIYNYNKFGTFVKPPLFYNNKEYDLITPHPPMKEYAVDEIRNQSRIKDYIYIINKDAQLIITDTMFPEPFNYNGQLYSYASHAELAQMLPVYASGQFLTDDGIGFRLGNESGHYYPGGEHLKGFVENIFVRNGFTEARDLFTYESGYLREPIILKNSEEARSYLITDAEDFIGKERPIISQQREAWFPYIGSGVIGGGSNYFINHMSSSITQESSFGHSNSQSNFSILDLFISPAHAAETADLNQSNYNLVGDFFNYAELPGVSTAGYLTSLYDYSLLKNSYSTYKSIASSSFPELFSTHMSEVEKLQPKEFIYEMRQLLFHNTFNKKYYASPITISIFKDNTAKDMLNLNWWKINNYKDAWNALNESIDGGLFSERGFNYLSLASHSLFGLSTLASAYYVGMADDKLDASIKEAYAFAGATLGGKIFSNGPAYYTSYLLENWFKDLKFNHPVACRSPYTSVPFAIAGAIFGSYGFIKLYDNTDHSEIGANLLADAWTTWRDYKTSSALYINTHTSNELGEIMQAVAQTDNHELVRSDQNQTLEKINQYLNNRSEMIKEVSLNYGPLGTSLFEKYFPYEEVDLVDANELTKLYANIIYNHPRSAEPLMKGDYLDVFDIIHQDHQATFFSEKNIYRLGLASKGLWLTGLGFAGYEVVEAKNPIKEIAHQSALIGSGVVGGELAGGLAGAEFLCGLAAPVCVGIAITGGSALAVVAADKGWQKAAEMWQSHYKHESLPLKKSAYLEDSSFGHSNSHQNNFSILDLFISPAHAAETADLDQDNYKLFGDFNFAELAEVSTAGYLTTLHDYSLLKNNYSSYKSVSSSSFPEFFSSHLIGVEKVIPEKFINEVWHLFFHKPFDTKYYASPILASLFKENTLKNVVNNIDLPKIRDYKNAWNAFNKSLDKGLFSQKGLFNIGFTSDSLFALSVLSSAYYVATADDKLNATTEEAYALAGATIGGKIFSNALAYFTPMTPYTSIPFAITGAIVGSYSFTKLYDSTDRSDVGANLLTDAWMIGRNFSPSSSLYQNHIALTSLYTKSKNELSEAMRVLAQTDHPELIKIYQNYSVNNLNQYLKHCGEVIEEVSVNFDSLGRSLYQKYFPYEDANIGKENTLTKLYTNIIYNHPSTAESLMKGEYLDVLDIINQDQQATYFSEKNISKLSLRLMSKALWLTGLGSAGYEVVEAKNPIKEMVRQSVLIGSGIIGSKITGVLAGADFLCGIAAPICVGTAITAGGVLAIVAADKGWHKAEEIWQSHHKHENLAPKNSTSDSSKKQTANVMEFYGAHKRNTFFKSPYDSLNAKQKSDQSSHQNIGEKNASY